MTPRSLLYFTVLYRRERAMKWSTQADTCVMCCSRCLPEEQLTVVHLFLQLSSNNFW